MRIRVAFAFFADLSRAVRRESERRPAGDGRQKWRRRAVIKRGNAGVELMHMIRKGQMNDGGVDRTVAAQFYSPVI